MTIKRVLFPRNYNNGLDMIYTSVLFKRNKIVKGHDHL